MGKATVQLPTTRRSRRHMYRRLPYGAIPGFAPICLDSNDPATVRCGFEKRMLGDVPLPTETTIRDLQDFVWRDVRDFPRVTKYTFDDWLASETSYDENRKQQLREAFVSLHGGMPSRRQCEHVDSFVKTESYDEYKHARLINSRTDAFKVFAGPLAKAMEDIVYDLEGDVQFIKHVPMSERPERIKALRQPGWYYYGTDYSSFECSFDRCKMDALEIPLYWTMLENYPPERAKFVRTIRGVNKMRTRTGIKAQCQARRMSGEMVTSLGNGWSNREVIRYIVWKKGGMVRGYVEGDDGIFATNVKLEAQDFERLGFKIKLVEVDDPCKASFCGMIFAESGEIVRDPRHFLNKFGWTHSFITAGKPIMQGLLRAKALSVLYETPQCPIIGAIAHEALRLTRDAVPRWVEDYGHPRPPDEFRAPVFEPALATRLLFEEIYGVSIASQLMLEQDICNGKLDRLSLIIEPHPHVAHYIARFLEVT